MGVSIGPKYTAPVRLYFLRPRKLTMLQFDEKKSSIFQSFYLPHIYIFNEKKNISEGKQGRAIHAELPGPLHGLLAMWMQINKGRTAHCYSKSHV